MLKKEFKSGILAAGCFLWIPLLLNAQINDTTVNPAARLQWMEEQSLWLQTENAAGLAATDIVQTGRTLLNWQNTDGAYKRPQQPGSTNSIGFMSERYQKTGNAVFYGRFTFARQRDKELVWSDVMDAYRGTPYIIADSLGGNWKKQLYGLKLNAASGKLLHDKITLGAGISYDLSTGARQNDPRPVSTVNELIVTPALLWHIGKNIHAGINGRYKMFKEEVGIGVRNYDKPQKIYRLAGVGIYKLPIETSSSESRNYIGNEYGGDLQLEATGRNWQWLTSAGMTTYSEDAQDNITKPEAGGRYTKTNLTGKTTFRLSAPLYQHQLQLAGSYSTAKGREYLQTYNPATLSFETIFSDIFSEYYDNAASLSYKLTRLSEKNFYNWTLEMKAAYKNIDNEYFYTQPSHQVLTRLNFSLEAKKNCTIGSNQLIAGIKAGYTTTTDNSLTFTGSTSGFITNIVAKEVLYPDHDYLIANGWNAALSLQYIFGIKTIQHTQFFVNGHAAIDQRISEGWYNLADQQRRSIQFAIGIIF